MPYQAATSPPGGVASADAIEASAPDPYIFNLYPGDSILAYFYPSQSDVFWTANTISFMAALSVIFLYVSGVTLKQKLFMCLQFGPPPHLTISMRQHIMLSLSDWLFGWD